MKLRPLDPDELQLAASWLAQKENYQWLDFGNGVQALSAQSLKFMLQRDIHAPMAFTSDADDLPIGLAVLSNIDRNFRTATLWFLLGDKRYAGQGYATRAISKILTHGFKELELQAVDAWAVDANIPSIRAMEHNNFRCIGRKRQCHYMDGRPYDRLLFDILAAEHQEV